MHLRVTLIRLYAEMYSCIAVICLHLCAVFRFSHECTELCLWFIFWPHATHTHTFVISIYPSSGIRRAAGNTWKSDRSRRVEPRLASAWIDSDVDQCVWKVAGGAWGISGVEFAAGRWYLSCGRRRSGDCPHLEPRPGRLSVELCPGIYSYCSSRPRGLQLCPGVAATARPVPGSAAAARAVPGDLQLCPGSAATARPMPGDLQPSLALTASAKSVHHYPARAQHTSLLHCTRVLETLSHCTSVLC